MMRNAILVGAVSLGLIAFPGAAQETASQIAIDYDGFADLTAEAAEHRKGRLLPLDEFLLRSARQDAIILDTRSAEAFAAGHIEGAINLPFSDFTQGKLRSVIGENRDRAIFIYCNNNFSDDEFPVALKRAPLALNIPTFINLYGYGYTNIWELEGVMALTQVPWIRGDRRPVVP